MSDESKVRGLLAPLGDRRVDLTGEAFKVDPSRVSEAILRAARQPVAVAARARWQVGAAWFTAAAAALLLVAGAVLREWAPGPAPVTSGNELRSPKPELAWAVSSLRGSVLRRDRGSEEPLAAGMTLAGELSSGPASAVQLSRTDGLQLELLERSRAEVSGLNATSGPPSIRVTAGAVRCLVPGSAVSEGFSVFSPGAAVFTRAAVFTVSITGTAAHPESCIRVESGDVTLEAPTGPQRLAAGRSWGCAEDATNVPPSRAKLKPERRASPPARVTRDSGSAGSLGAGTLDEENRLFQAGLSSERGGDPKAAAAWFEQLLQRYPKSPLAEETRRALRRVKPAEREAP